MKTLLILLCILVIGATAVFTTIENNAIELVQSANKLINLKKASDIESLEDHVRHNDLVQINGKTLCEKTQSFYNTK